jgi:hypothetical protein
LVHHAEPLRKETTFILTPKVSLDFVPLDLAASVKSHRWFKLIEFGLVGNNTILITSYGMLTTIL